MSRAGGTRMVVLKRDNTEAARYGGALSPSDLVEF